MVPLCWLSSDQMTRQVYQSEQRYRAVVEDTPLLICTYLPDTTLTFVNESCCCYFQRSREELLGLSFLELLPEEGHAAVREVVAGLTSMVQGVEHLVLAQDGAEGWLCWTNRALLDAAGCVIACQAIGEDITERKQAEQRLHNEKVFIDTAIDSLPGIFYLFTREGRFLRWNRNFETVSGYTKDEIMAMHPRDFFPVEEQATVEERIREVFADGELSVEAHGHGYNPGYHRA